jgi:hypothetical protein
MDCGRLWNRDTNAASNIYNIARCAQQGLERPDYLRRALVNNDEDIDNDIDSD